MRSFWFQVSATVAGGLITWWIIDNARAPAGYTNAINQRKGYLDAF